MRSTYDYYFQKLAGVTVPCQITTQMWQVIPHTHVPFPVHEVWNPGNLDAFSIHKHKINIKL
jgi:hypothetical protein